MTTSSPVASSPTQSAVPAPPRPLRESDHSTPKGDLWALSVAALGVVYGDIGTSPLYAFRECFLGTHGLAPNRANVMGLLSLVFWALTLVVSLKYLQYVMRADDDGEGGILALMALASKRRGIRHAGIIVLLGLFGAGLLVGDGMIAPAISVLSAVEGLSLAAPSFSHFVVPVTVAILIGLFAVQSQGTGRVGIIFGPIIIVWFLALAILGLATLVREPSVLWAIDPRYAVRFFVQHRITAFIALGTVFLVVTGGEALYADMGHFGSRPIRRTWFAFVLPALLLNYFGQGALLLRNPKAVAQPFYGLAPSWFLMPMICLSTLAAIIASQAVISGVYSLTRQATMLGFWPRVQIQHTSAHHQGQIYVPSINAFLMVATVLVVFGFRESSRLAAAYGIGITLTMITTTLLAFVVARQLWRWPLVALIPLTIALLTIDLSFLSANLLKIARGGWFPLLVASGAVFLMLCWKHGRHLLALRVKENLVPLDDFHELLRVERPARVPGTAVFMTSNKTGTPPALLFNFVHNHVVHERVILLTVTMLGTARIPEVERLKVERLQDGFFRVEASYGFMETPDVPSMLAATQIPDLSPEHTTYFLGREAVVPVRRQRRSVRLRVFGALSRNAASVTDFFHLPPDRVMEIGSQVQL